MKKRYFWFFAVVLIWILIMPGSVYPCGPFFRAAVFVSTRPENPVTYVDGNLGVLQRTYSRSDLLVAWRVLTKQPLTDVEKKALASGPGQTAPSSSSVPQPSWRDLRNTVPGLGELRFVSDQRELKDYQFFTNCGDDAFINARNTLAARIATYGISSAEVKDWAAAQDIVFQNCDKGSALPAPAAASTPALLRADRGYQIAAANFYAMNYDASAEQFMAIAGDKSSPWRKYGVFLAARSFIRKATVGPLRLENPEQTPPDASLKRAEELLAQVLRDPSAQELHASARRLQSFVALHLHPHEQLRMLSATLSKPSRDPNFKQQVTDYLYLMAQAGAKDEMGEWIDYVREGSSEEDKVLARWKQNPNELPWLIAALMSASQKSADNNALIDAALKVPANSPAYPSARYHAARLLLTKGDLAAARQLIDAYLAKAPKDLPHSAVNAFMILRGEAASDVADFAHFAVLMPVSEDWDYGSDGGPEGLCSAKTKCTPMIPATVGDALNHMPASMLVRIAQNSDAPFPLRRGAALVAFERGILLQDFQVADNAAHAATELSPADAADLADYMRSQGKEQKQFVAAVVMLRWPGAAPAFLTDTIRDEPMRKIDNFRRNWWCDSLFSARKQAATPGAKVEKIAYPKFLTLEERAGVEHESEKLQSIDSAPNYLGRMVTSWARSHQDDARVPEALYLVVRSTRYGCTDEDSGTVSKTAFDMLHKNYPNNEWTRKTPYYFKD